MTRLQEIEARLAEIATDINTRGATIPTEELATLNQEVTDLKAERAQIVQDAQTRNNILSGIAEGHIGTPAPTHTPGNLRGAYPTPGAIPTEQRTAQIDPTDPSDTPEYRNAFMNFVARGVAIPAELRANLTTTTTDTSAVIPTTLMREIISEMKSYGNIFAKVRKLNVEGGVEFPILTLKPKAKWITETSSSDDQKAQADEKVSFLYYGLEVKIAQSILSRVVSFDEFKDSFVALASEAMVARIEASIVSGAGTGSPKGVTKDSRIPAGNVITLTPADIESYSAWKKKVFAKMKKSYRKGEFTFAQATFDGYIDGMVDKQGQPIGRVNYGIDGAENYRFCGKTVETVEEDILPAYDDAETGDVFGIFIDWSNYAINSNMQMEIVKWTDHDDNKEKTKAIMIVDGKILDPNGVLLLKKGAAAAGGGGE